jgi:hypothetical protein
VSVDVEAFRARLGKTLQHLVWMPLAGTDTPDLVAQYEQSSFWYTGAVLLAFEDQPDLYLTWQQQGHDIGLITDEPELSWGRFSLDHINASWNGLWEGIQGSCLTDVELFSIDDVGASCIVAIKLSLRTTLGKRELWIASGYEPVAGDGDDLYIGLDVPPTVGAVLTKAGALHFTL